MSRKGKNKSNKIKTEVNDDIITNLQLYSDGSSSNTGYTSFENVFLKQNADITVSDLKAVQYTLEHIMVKIVKKKKLLESKVSSLESVQSRKEKRSKSTDSVEKKSTDERPPKKAKESTSKASLQSKPQYIQVPYIDSHIETARPPKEGPSRFWTLIEPYCGDITQDTIRMLEDWIKPQESDDKYQQIPDLGEHFSIKWSIEDLKEELKEGSKSVENNKGLFSGSVHDYEEIERVFRNGKSEINFEKSSNQDCSLQDRIICSLVGENLMTPLHDNMKQVSLDDDEDNHRTNTSVLNPSSLTVSENLHERLMKDFINAGLVGEASPRCQDDEVLAELKRLQSALIPVRVHNLRQKQRLLALAKAEMARQEAKKKLQEYDAKLMEVYRNVSSARKSGTMNKKLEEQAKRTLRERKKLFEKMTSML